ncbi:MAG: hypothetical protein ACFWUM_02785 [Eubacteriales bacterium]
MDMGPYTAFFYALHSGGGLRHPIESLCLKDNFPPPPDFNKPFHTPCNSLVCAKPYIASGFPGVSDLPGGKPELTQRTTYLHFMEMWCLTYGAPAIQPRRGAAFLYLPVL